MIVARRVGLLLLAGLSLALLFYVSRFESVCVKDSNLYLLEEVSNESYKLDSENTVTSNLSGLSNAIISLKDEGYVVYEVKSDNKCIDIIVQNNELGIVYRYYYDANSKLITCFCNTYENSYRGLTYIIE